MMDFLADTTVQFTLSREELAYLVRLIGATHMPGLPHNAATILASGSNDSLAPVAERSLLARGLLRVSENRRLQMDALLRNVIQLCIRPAYVVSIAAAEQDSQYSELHIFNIVPNVTVLHELPIAGIHRLTAVTGEEFSLMDAVMAFLPNTTYIAKRRLQLHISSLLQAPPVTDEYTIRHEGDQYWLSEQRGEQDGAEAAKQTVTRTELIARLESIGEPIRAISTLQIEPQP